MDANCDNSRRFYYRCDGQHSAAIRDLQLKVDAFFDVDISLHGTRSMMAAIQRSHEGETLLAATAAVLEEAPFLFRLSDSQFRSR